MRQYLRVTPPAVDAVDEAAADVACHRSTARNAGIDKPASVCLSATAPHNTFENTPVNDVVDSELYHRFDCIRSLGFYSPAA